MFKQLKLYYLFVSLPFIMLLGGSVIFFDAIKSTIDSNPHPQINYTIFVIIIVGGFFIILNSVRLVREAKILKEFTEAVQAKVDLTTLQELTNRFKGDIACILQMVATSADRSISHQEQAALEHELANSRSRLTRRNALPSYLTGLLVGMGLLGTFIGLLATLADIGALIGSFSDLDMTAADPIVVFGNMIEKMKAPMASMAIAFSASMFGLLGSIILGLMMVGLKRLQGDIFSVLTSEVARHIEIALSFESISFRDPEAIGVAGETGEFTARILLRIEERMAEAARLRQRALSTEINDFKIQRADMLQVLTEQTEASNSFRGELQQLGSQLGTIFNGMEQRNSEISNQISELTVHLSGDAKETHKLLGSQIEEQKRLLDTLGSYNIEERLAESARSQQRALTSVIDDFKNQREEMLQTLSGQTEASKSFRNELQQLGGQLGTIFNSMEAGNSEISSQISELTVHLGADAKESHRLLNVTSSNVRSELQQLGGHLGKQLVNLYNSAEKGNGEICSQIAELQEHMVVEAKESQQQLDTTSHDVRSELQQVGGQLGSQFNATSNEMRGELQQLGNQLGTLFNATEKGTDAVCNQIVELMGTLADGARDSHKRLDATSHNVSGELQQLGKQLGTIFHSMEKGSGELASQISELMHHRSSDAKESHELLTKLLTAHKSMQMSEQEG